MSYKKFVMERLSPYRTPTRREFNISHCALGIATEFMEYQMSKTRDNEEEELGDLLFYFTAFGETLEVVLPSQADEETDGALEIKHVEALLSCAKKDVFYRQEDTGIETYLLVAWNEFLKLLDVSGITLEELIKVNKKKLAKRYQSGFTTEESKLRKDKTNE